MLFFIKIPICNDDRCTMCKVSVFEVFLIRIQSTCGKIRTRKTPNTDTFPEAMAWGVLRTLSSIYDGAFCENSKQLLVVNYRKTASLQILGEVLHMPLITVVNKEKQNLFSFPLFLTNPNLTYFNSKPAIKSNSIRITYKLAKFVASILKFLTCNDDTTKY